MGTGTGTSAVAGTGRKAPEMQPNLPSTEYIKKYTVENGRQEKKIRKDGREGRFKLRATEGKNIKNGLRMDEMRRLQNHS